MSSDIPKTVFIQQYEDPEIEGFQTGKDVTWCVDRVNDHDVEYINVKEYKKLEDIISGVEVLADMGASRGAILDFLKKKRG